MALLGTTGNAPHVEALGWQAWSSALPSVEEIAKPIARAINIYSRVARRELDDETRRELARHIRTLANQGIEDPNRLTVHGLSYLRRHEPRRRRPKRSNGSRT